MFGEDARFTKGTPLLLQYAQNHRPANPKGRSGGSLDLNRTNPGSEYGVWAPRKQDGHQDLGSP